MYSFFRSLPSLSLRIRLALAFLSQREEEECLATGQVFINSKWFER